MAARSLVARFIDSFRSIFKRDPEKPAPEPRKRVLESASLVDAESWANSGKFMLDPHLRVAYSLLQAGDAKLVFQRTGMRMSEGLVKPKLPVHVTVSKRLTANDVGELRINAGLHIPPAYINRGEGGSFLRSVTGYVDTTLLQQSLQRIVASPLVNDVRLPLPLLPCDVDIPDECFADFHLPAERAITINGNSYVADGKGVVIGIIDDGCCFAHWNFLRDGPASRLVYIWDQGRQSSGKYWQPVNDYGYGYELLNVPVGQSPPPIDAALKNHTNNGVIDEDAVYREIDYFPYATLEGRRFNPSTHGTHVMDIAAGNGRALFGNVGVAPAATIIFVQLPPELVIEGGPALTKCVEDGVDYIVKRVEALQTAKGAPIPLAINISYGGYAGPHDGLSDIEKHMDDLLATKDRAIVISAGNGFAARCHASGSVTTVKDAALRWQIEPFDESMNLLEIWYSGPPDLGVYVTPPGLPELGPVIAGQRKNIVNTNTGGVVGYVDHVTDPNNNRHFILVALHPTANGTTPGIPLAASTIELAPNGTWRIRLAKTQAGTPNDFHAWIERDEMRRRTTTRRVQSTLHDDDVDPCHTITGIATGHSTIAVGGYDVATREMAEYSACGPTRPYPAAPHAREKPEVCAPCAFEANGRGVSSAATRFALRTRMAGTSVSAPFVTGLAALVLQLNRDLGHAPLDVDQLRFYITKGASGGLRANRHQAADDHQKEKQSDPRVWKHLAGKGRADALATLRLIK